MWNIYDVIISFKDILRTEYNCTSKYVCIFIIILIYVYVWTKNIKKYVNNKYDIL